MTSMQTSSQNTYDASVTAAAATCRWGGALAACILAAPSLGTSERAIGAVLFLGVGLADAYFLRRELAARRPDGHRRRLARVKEFTRPRPVQAPEEQPRLLATAPAPAEPSSPPAAAPETQLSPMDALRARLKEVRAQRGVTQREWRAR